MRLISVIALGLLPIMAQAQESPAQATILNQIEAFKADDFAGAFAFASPTIKQIFGTPEAFGLMVQQGYPMVHRPDAVQMLGERMVAGQLHQQVLLTDSAGRSHVLDYRMIETAEGWQIDGVTLLREAGLGA